MPDCGSVTTRLTITAVGASGGSSDSDFPGAGETVPGGLGGVNVVSGPFVPGHVLDVYVGEKGEDASAGGDGGWPGGGDGGGDDSGAGGGGSSGWEDQSSPFDWADAGGGGRTPLHSARLRDG